MMPPRPTAVRSRVGHEQIRVAPSPRALIYGLILILTLAWGGQRAVSADSPFPAATPESQGLSAEALQQLGGVVKGFVDADEILGAELLVIKNRRTVLHEGFGLLDREHNRPVLPDSIWCIRSMTKVLVGASAQMLIDAGRLDLRDPVAKYLPYFDNQRCRAMTVEHLLTHSSGLPLTALLTNKLGKTLDEIARHSAETGPIFEPGARFEYSDDGTEVLGTLMSKVVGEPVENYITRELLQAVGMKDTTCLLKKDDPRLSRFTSAYSGYIGNWIKLWEPGQDPIFTTFLPSQSAFSTTMDYARFLALFMDGGMVGQRRLLSDAAVKRVLTPAFAMSLPHSIDGAELKYGQMMMLYVKPDGKLLAFGHGGSDGTHAYAFPELDLLVMYFTQSRGNRTYLRFESAMQRLLIEGRLLPTSPTAESEKDLRRFLGIYWDEEKDSTQYISVHIRDGKLTLEAPWETIYPLQRAKDGGADAWNIEMATSVKVNFEGDDNGLATRFTIEKPNRKLRWVRLVGQPDLPSAQQIMQLVRRAHGIDRLAQIGPVRITSKLSRKEPPLDGTANSIIDGPTRYRYDITLGDYRETVAMDGKAVWSADASGPARELKAIAAEQALLGHPAVTFGGWTDAFTEVSVLASAKVEDRPVFVVRCVPPQANAHTYLVDSESGELLGAMRVEHVEGLGQVGTRVRYEAFRDVDGVRLPSKTSTKYSTRLLGHFVDEVTNVETGVTFPADFFRLPPAP